MYLASVYLLFIDMFLNVHLFCSRIWRVYLNAAKNSIMPFEYGKAMLYYRCMTEIMLQWLNGNLPHGLKPWILGELYV